MTTDLISQLHLCEQRVERHLETLRDMAAALREIRDKELFRAAGHDNWAAYLKARWGRTDRWARLIVESDATLASVQAHLPEHVPAPARLTDAQGLAGLEPAEAADVWTAAVEESDGEPPTRSTVEAVKARARPGAATGPASTWLGHDGDFNDAMKAARQLGMMIAGLSNEEWGAAVPSTECARIIKELATLIDLARPTAACTVCSDARPNPTCKRCKGRGWVTKGATKWGPKR